MASNAELQSQVEELCKELGIDPVDTSEMNNKDLTAKVKELKALQDDESEDAKDDESEDIEEVKPPYYIADGKSVACKKGVLAEGKEIKAEYLGGGKEALKSLVKIGAVVDNT